MISRCQCTSNDTWLDHKKQAYVCCTCRKIFVTLLDWDILLGTSGTYANTLRAKILAIAEIRRLNKEPIPDTVLYVTSWS